MSKRRRLTIRVMPEIEAEDTARRGSPISAVGRIRHLTFNEKIAIIGAASAAIAAFASLIDLVAR